MGVASDKRGNTRTYYTRREVKKSQRYVPALFATATHRLYVYHLATRENIGYLRFRTAPIQAFINLLFLSDAFDDDGMYSPRPHGKLREK